MASLDAVGGSSVVVVLPLVLAIMSNQLLGVAGDAGATRPATEVLLDPAVIDVMGASEVSG